LFSDSSLQEIKKEIDNVAAGSKSGLLTKWKRIATVKLEQDTILKLIKRIDGTFRRFSAGSHPRTDLPLTFEAGCDESGAFAANFRFESPGIRTKVGTTAVPGSIIYQAGRLYVYYIL